MESFRLLEQQFCESWGNINEKKPTPNEGAAISHARRSIFTAVQIEKDSVIREQDLIMKRPGDGISPMHIDKFIGKIANQTIDEDTQLTNDMIYD